MAVNDVYENYIEIIVFVFKKNEIHKAGTAHAEKERLGKPRKAQDIKLHTEGNSSSELSGPPDSHEAMNNRDTSSKQSKSNREKRSYEFLMGLVNNNSRFEVTNVDLPTPTDRKRNQIAKNQALLELMIKIAADPEQWEKVHRLLQKIDNDLITSKKLFDSIQNSIEDINNFSSVAHPIANENSSIRRNEDVERLNKSTEHVAVKKQGEVTTDVSNDNSTIELQKMVVILNGDKQRSLPGKSVEALKTNKWPDFEGEGKVVYKPNSDLERQNVDPRYNWQSGNTGSKSYPRNFAYHRVTGNPLYHSNLDKNPKAYIAVSVIAPKPLHSRSQEEDLILENELRQLKPWNSNKSFKSMAVGRSRWIAPSDNNKTLFQLK
ncbi:hypothetical protein RI129_002448 [Pyrocoelia pectoralis]|uniref:Uncharacterized protein n=1 Tax=Pyrocoelia pectoralis TaxID=417401 RepID=A0AAN7ZT69_9COLE